MSTVDSPVTVPADVAINKQSIQETDSSCANGIYKRVAPIKIASKNPPAIKRAGFSNTIR